MPDNQWITVRCTNCGHWVKVPLVIAVNGAATCAWCGLPTPVSDRQSEAHADAV